MSENQSPPDVWSRLWKTIGHLLGALLRVLFVVVIAILLAAGVYLGAPWVYRQVIQPVQSSVMQVALLQRQMDEAKVQWAESFGEQQQRITDLESQLAGQGERIANLEAGLSRIEETLTNQQTTLDALSTDIAAFSSDYASREKMEMLSDDFAALQEEITFAEQTTAQVKALEYRSLLTQIWLETLKSHLYLTEDNVSDAETTLELAMKHIDQAAALGSEDEQEAIADIQARLTQAASRLRNQPILAAQDLESIWYELDALVTPPEQ